MARTGICSICGGIASPAYTCGLCGALVCSRCFVIESGICIRCAAKFKRQGWEI